MSTTIDLSFVKQFEREVHEAYQRQGSLLRGTVRTKNNIRGASTTFQKVGKGSATKKARHGVITPMNQDHTPIECTLEDFYAGDWVDKLDELKVNHDEREVVANAGAWGLGRETDDLVITAAGTTSETPVAWTLTNPATIRNSLLTMSQRLDDNDVPNDGQRYGLLTPKAWAFAMTVEEFANSDFIGMNGLPFKEGAPVGQRWKSWNGVLWKVHTGVTGRGTNTAAPFVYHRTALGHAIGAEVESDITWHGDRAAHFVNNMMSQGACLIDGTGVIPATVDDTAALPAS